MENVSTGQAIRTVRKKLGLTQKEVADYLGITSANISQIESGNRKNLSFETIAKLCEVFSKKSGKSYFPQDFGYDLGYHKKEDNHYYHYYYYFDRYAENEETIISAFSKLNEDGQKVAIERVEELTEIKKYRKSENETSGKE